MTTSSLHGIYLLLDEQWSKNISLAQVMELAIQCGIRLFQYRNKTDSMLDSYHKALILRKLAFNNGVTFIVNDRCDLAIALDADGVHLGQDDLFLESAQSIMGKEKIIGISTHRPEEVKAANKDGADYLGFGPIFPTITKADHKPFVGIEGLKHIRSLTSLPVFAIGGIALESIPFIQEAGGDGIVVASVVYNARNIKYTLQQLVNLFPSSN